jgi:hypothetical protein
MTTPIENPPILPDIAAGQTAHNRAVREAAAFEARIEKRVTEAAPLAPEHRQFTVNKLVRTTAGHDYVVVKTCTLSLPAVNATARPGRVGYTPKGPPSEFMLAFFSGEEPWKRATDNQVWAKASEWASSTQADPRTAARITRNVNDALRLRAGLGRFNVREYGEAGLV